VFLPHFILYASVPEPLVSEVAMASDGSDEYVFAIPNFWQPSKLLLDLEAEAPSSFFSNDATSKPLAIYIVVF
jgi:hypothetical protein